MSNKITERVGLEKINNQGCLMKIIEYINNKNIIVEFQDEYKYHKTTTWSNFKNGKPKNPYFKSVLNVGMIGTKYPTSINNKHTKEYYAWYNMLQRCFEPKLKERCPTYQDVTCCEEWLLYENFYEWLHAQENFDRWLNGENWNLDKDIIYKGNKIYSPENCCLVPHNVNVLFVKANSIRGNLPIGVTFRNDTQKYVAQCCDGNNEQNIKLGCYSTVNESFNKYKEYKEKIIKQIANEEFKNNNIIKRCYEAMMNYQVEMDD